MSFLESFLCFLMNLCYHTCNNYWISIVLFTAITMILFLPLMLWSQKNCIIIEKIMPWANKVKIQYYCDEDTIANKQREIFKKEHCHPLLSIIPLAVQAVILVRLAVIHHITDTGKMKPMAAPLPKMAYGVIYGRPWPVFPLGSSSNNTLNKINLLHME